MPSVPTDDFNASLRWFEKAIDDIAKGDNRGAYQGLMQAKYYMSRNWYEKAHKVPLQDPFPSKPELVT